MKTSTSLKIALLVIMMPSITYAFESGSTGADGAFNPTATTTLTLPPSGIYNFTDVNIPTGVIVRFNKNANNTPITILATGDVTIDGDIRINGGVSSNITTTPQTTDGDFGLGAPGGFDGGTGGLFLSSGFSSAGNGKGPGAGRGGFGVTVFSGLGCGGAGGGHGTAGAETDGGINACTGVTPGSAYGNAQLVPMIGGSGGGGGAGGTTQKGSGGGGGGGAILIAATGTVTINGSILANGGASGTNINGANFGRLVGGSGGGGAGGAIRIVATTIQGEGSISAVGANGGNTSSGAARGSTGGNGRIRLEADNFLRASNTTPAYSFTTPRPIFFSNFPSVRITTIGSEAVPSSPTGFRDVILTGATTNPVTIGFETTNVPVGTTISLTAAPERGSATTASSTPVAGSTTLGTATADITLPNGNSTLLGRASFTATVADNADAIEFSKYAQGEKVEKFRVDVNTDGKSETTFITVNGKEFTYPSNAIAMN